MATVARKQRFCKLVYGKIVVKVLNEKYKITKKYYYRENNMSTLNSSKL